MDALTREQRAASLLRDELIVEALETLEQTYTEIWKQSGPEEKEQREQAYNLVRACEMFRGHLESVVMTGTLTREQQKTLRI